MAVGFIILEKNEFMAHEISRKLSKVWVLAEIILFALVGAQVNVDVALKAGGAAALLVGLGLVARSVGSYVCLLGSDLTIAERLFVVVAYLPKATVQAAIGSAPLMAMQAAGMNTHPGEIILAVAALSILLTAPVGAWAIRILGDRVLESEETSATGQASAEQVEEDVLKVLDESEVGNGLEKSLLPDLGGKEERQSQKNGRNGEIGPVDDQPLPGRTAPVDLPDVVEGILDGVHQLEGEKDEDEGPEDAQGSGVLGEVGDVFRDHLLVVLEGEEVS